MPFLMGKISSVDVNKSKFLFCNDQIKLFVWAGLYGSDTLGLSALEGFSYLVADTTTCDPYLPRGF